MQTDRKDSDDYSSRLLRGRETLQDSLGSGWPGRPFLRQSWLGDAAPGRKAKGERTRSRRTSVKLLKKRLTDRREDVGR